jgi:hypothetical protein
VLRVETTRAPAVSLKSKLGDLNTKLPEIRHQNSYLKSAFIHKGFMGFKGITLKKNFLGVTNRVGQSPKNE